MAEHDLNASLFLLKALENNLLQLSKNIADSEHILSNMRRDWIGLESKYRAFKQELESEPKK